MIYLDLDETLINVMPCYGNVSAHRHLFKSDDGNYAGIKRPLADRLIEFCRRLAPTKILTMASRDYALYWNEVFKLGFEETDILARNDYLEIIQGGGWYGGGVDILLLAKNVCPDAVLIDNQHHDEQWAKAKRGYLGIGPERYIKIRAFDGRDPEKFTTELCEIECKLQNLKG